MQPNEGFSTPRRALDVEDYIDILRRHKGWIFGPFLLSLVASVVGVYLWPDTYVSTAMVKITPQQIPETLVPSSINQQMFDRINSMEQDVLSRTSLTTMINTYNLYPSERKRLPVDDIVEQMRKKVQIQIVAPEVTGSSHTIPAFAIQFSYSDPHATQRVVQELVTKFIDESQRNRSNQTYQTTKFMEDELDQAKKDLEGTENKLTEFRMKNNGRLPDQVEGNMQTLQALSTQSASLDMNISRATQEKLQLETRLRIATDQLADLNKLPPENVMAAAQKNERLAQADQQIQHLEDFVRALRQKYTDKNPDVQGALAQLNAARQNRDAIAKEVDTAKKDTKAAPVRRPENPMLAKEKRDLDATVQQLQSAIQAKDLEIADYNKEMKRDTDAMKAYQARVEAMPLGQKEYADLMRDDTLAKDRVVQLTQRLERAQVAQNMEDRKQGEMLEQLDPASLPVSPTQPNRPLVIAIGAAVGLLLGIVIAGAREMKDTSLKNLKDVRAYTQMAILGSVPLLENDFVVRRRKRLAWLGWTTACLAAVVIMAGAVVYYQISKGGA